jgi:hypothetical protein
LRENNQKHEENNAQAACKNFQKIGHRPLCRRGRVPHDKKIVVAAAQAFDGEVSVLAGGIVLFPQTLIGMVKEF